MQIFHQLLTFGVAPVAITVGPSAVYRIRVEPATSNTHDCFILASDVATGATGSTDGVIKRIAKSPTADSGTITDAFDLGVEKGADPIQTSQFLFDGTSGEKVRVTLFVY